jgi:hypothetical protein
MGESKGRSFGVLGAVLLGMAPAVAAAQTPRELAAHPAFVPMVQACEALRRYESASASVAPNLGGVRPEVLDSCRRRDLRPLVSAATSPEDSGGLLIQAERLERVVSALRECRPSAVTTPPTTPASPPDENATAIQRWCVSDRAAPAPPSPRMGGAEPSVVEWTTQFAETLLAGLAQHLATRARIELQQSVLADVRQRLCNVEPQRSLLVSTCAALGAGGGEALGATFGRTFIEALTRDASQLPRSVANLFDRCRLPDLATCSNGPVGARSLGQLQLRLALEVMATLVETTDIPTFARNLTRVADAWVCAEGDSTCASARVLMARVFELLELTARRELNANVMTWVALDAMREAQVLVRPVTTTPSTSPAPTMATSPNPVEVLRLASEQRVIAALGRLSAAVTSLKTAMDQLQTPPADVAARQQRVAEVAREVIALVNAALAMPGAVDPEKAITFRVPPSLAELAVAVSSGAVPRMLVTTFRVLQEVLAALPATERFVLPAEAVRLLSVGAELAAARNADEAAAVMDGFLAPAGAWRAKGLRPFNASVTGLVGLSGGVEWPVYGSGPGARGGLFAPVGVDFTGRLSGGWSLGVFIPLIDLGALLPYSYNEGASTRTSSGAMTTQNREFDPLRFVAPGLYVRAGVARTPLVLGLGASYQPGAYSLTQGGDATSAREGAFTVQGFLAVDVTLWNF